MCQLDEAIEPQPSTSTTTDHRKDENIEEDEKSEKNQEKLFVPVKGKGRNKKQDNSAEAIKLLKKIVETDNTTTVIDSLRDEMEKSREHELKLFQMMCQTFTARSKTTTSRIFSPNPDTQCAIAVITIQPSKSTTFYSLY